MRDRVVAHEDPSMGAFREHPIRLIDQPVHRRILETPVY